MYLLWNPVNMNCANARNYFNHGSNINDPPAPKKFSFLNNVNIFTSLAVSSCASTEISVMDKFSYDKNPDLNVRDLSTLKNKSKKIASQNAVYLKK